MGFPRRFSARAQALAVLARLAVVERRRVTRHMSLARLAVVERRRVSAARTFWLSLAY
jgi:hypothetical protein